MCPGTKRFGVLVPHSRYAGGRIPLRWAETSRLRMSKTWSAEPAKTHYVQICSFDSLNTGAGDGHGCLRARFLSNQQRCRTQVTGEHYSTNANAERRSPW